MNVLAFAVIMGHFLNLPTVYQKYFRFVYLRFYMGCTYMVIGMKASDC